MRHCGTGKEVLGCIQISTQILVVSFASMGSWFLSDFLDLSYHVCSGDNTIKLNI